MIRDPRTRTFHRLEDVSFRVRACLAMTRNRQTRIGPRFSKFCWPWFGPVRDFKFCWSGLVLGLGNLSGLRSQKFTLGPTGFGPWILGHDVILEMKRMNWVGMIFRHSLPLLLYVFLLLLPTKVQSGSRDKRPILIILLGRTRPPSQWF